MQIFVSHGRLFASSALQDSLFQQSSKSGLCLIYSLSCLAVLIPPFIQPCLIFESDSLQRKTALGQLLVTSYPTSIEKPFGVACAAAAPPSSPGSQLDDMELSFLDSFLSPLKSCKSPRPSHLGRSPRSSPAQLLSPAQSLSPAQAFNSLAHAFEQVGLRIVMYTFVLQPHFQTQYANPALAVWLARLCRAFDLKFDGTPSLAKLAKVSKVNLTCYAGLPDPTVPSGHGAQEAPILACNASKHAYLPRRSGSSSQRRHNYNYLATEGPGDSQREHPTRSLLTGCTLRVGKPGSIREGALAWAGWVQP